MVAQEDDDMIMVIDDDDEDETDDNTETTENDEELARQLQVCVYMFISSLCNPHLYKRCFVRFRYLRMQ